MASGSHSHWGAFEAVLKEGRLVDVKPFSRDPHPSPLIRAIPSAIYAESRIDRPMVRESYYRGDRSAGARRGTELFVPLSADSDEAAQAFRFDGAQCSELMSPWAWGLAGW